jgi:hypothetical protein
MTTDVRAYVRQFSLGGDVGPSACDSAECRNDNNRRAYKSVACGDGSLGKDFDTIRQCTSVNPDICQIPGGPTSNNYSFESPNEQGNTADTDMTVMCIYSEKNFVTNSDVIAFYNYFGQNEFQDTNLKNFDKVMKKKCFERVEGESAACLMDYTRTAPMKKCSKIFENSDIGAICNSWHRNNLGTEMSTAVNNFCNTVRDGGFGECDCFFREKDKDFQLYKASMPGIDPACYWLSCEPKANTLKEMPADLDPTCPTTVCSQVTYINTESNIAFTSVNQKISCNESFSIADSGAQTVFKWTLTFLVLAFVILVIAMIAKG